MPGVKDYSALQFQREGSRLRYCGRCESLAYSQSEPGRWIGTRV